MKTHISGSVMPVLEILLEPGDTLLAETGELAWKTPNVTLRTTTAAANAGGFFGALGRAFAGGGVFMTEYGTDHQQGIVAFAAKVPGHIVEHAISPGASYMVHRHGFLCGTAGVSLAAGITQSIGTGLFGGNGFVMQKISGQGKAWLELGGEIVTKTLQPGQTLDVHPGHVGMFDASMGYELTTIPGIRNKIFGGDGIFLLRLTGPGMVWLQTMPVPTLAHALTPYLPTGTAVETTTTSSATGAVVGQIVGSLFKD